MIEKKILFFNNKAVSIKKVHSDIFILFDSNIQIEFKFCELLIQI